MRKLSEVLTERALKKLPRQKEKNRAAFLACIEEIKEVAGNGWNIKDIWEALRDEGRISFGYEVFRRYVNRLVLNEQGKQEDPNEKNSQGTVPAKVANGKSGTGPGDAAGRIPRFDWEGRKTKKEDLI
jgi:hypothetical protein